MTDEKPRLTRERVLDAMKRTKTVKEAADLLGVHRVSLHRYMREQDIRIENERRIVAA